MRPIRKGVVALTAGLILSVAPLAPVAAFADDQNTLSDDNGVAVLSVESVQDGASGSVDSSDASQKSEKAVDSGEPETESDSATVESTGTSEAQGSTSGLLADEGEELQSTSASSEDNSNAELIDGTVIATDSEGSLIRDDQGIKFLLNSGELLMGSWHTIGSDRYYFGDDGYACTGPTQIDGKLYYLSETDGALVRSSWYTWDDGGRSYFNSEGKAAIYWWTFTNGKRYYFNPDDACHKAASGPTMIDGKLYCFRPADSATNPCARVTGWYSWGDGTRSYFRPSDGKAAIGWWKINGKYYYFDSSDEYRRAVEGKQTINGYIYYFDSTGARWTGLKTWSDGTKSYFSPKHSGRAAVGAWTIGGKRYYFSSSTRVSISGWRTWSDGTHSYYAASQGYAALKGSWSVGGKWYYFNSKCRTTTGWHTWSDGTKSYFSKAHNGAAAVGWWHMSDGCSYYFRSGARHKACTKGRWTINGKKYYFDSYCARVESTWVYWDDGTVSYFLSDGSMATGTITVNGTKYNMGTSGKIAVSNPRVNMIGRAQRQTSSTGWLLLVDTTNNYVGVFKQASNGWKIQYYWRCSTGSLGVHATPSGTYKTGYRGYVFGHGYSCYYYTQIVNQVLFHSTKYYEGTMVSMDSRLGMHISNGCVRLNINNAKWIYNNIPKGTTVRVYRP